MTVVDTSVMQERIGQLCHQFKLPTMGAQSVARFTASGHGDALPIFLEVLEQEAEDRRHRRINRLRQSSRLPSGKTWETFEHDRMPLALRQQLDHLAQGSFVEHGVNVLAFGLPGTGKTHALCALGHRLVEAGHSVLFAPAYRLVQELLAAKRDLDLPRRLRKLDNFDFLLLDDLGYLPQGAEESEVLFTLIAERYERRSLGITSNLVFSEWERIFANPMATAAAIDRVVHHSVILEFDVPSYRTDAAQQRGQAEEVNRQIWLTRDAGWTQYRVAEVGGTLWVCPTIVPHFDAETGLRGPIDTIRRLIGAIIEILACRRSDSPLRHQDTSPPSGLLPETAC